MSRPALPFSLDRQRGCRVGLTDAECFAIARVARQLPGAWYVQRDDDRGNVSISLVPDGGDKDAGDRDGGDKDGGDRDDGAPMFVVWREGGRLQLGHGQGELHAGLGAHADVQAAMNAVRRILDSASPVAGPG